MITYPATKLMQRHKHFKQLNKRSILNLFSKFTTVVIKSKDTQPIKNYTTDLLDENHAFYSFASSKIEGLMED